MARHPGADRLRADRRAEVAEDVGEFVPVAIDQHASLLLVDAAEVPRRLQDDA